MCEHQNLKCLNKARSKHYTSWYYKKEEKKEKEAYYFVKELSSVNIFEHNVYLGFACHYLLQVEMVT